MKKIEFIKAVSEKLGTTQKEARATLESVFETIEDELVEGKKVPLGELGYVEVRNRAERNGFNPSTREPMVIPASKVVAYKSSKYAKSLVN